MGPIIWNKTSIIKLILNNPIDQKLNFSIFQSCKFSMPCCDSVSSSSFSRWKLPKKHPRKRMSKKFRALKSQQHPTFTLSYFSLDICKVATARISHKHILSRNKASTVIQHGALRMAGLGRKKSKLHVTAILAM